MNFLRALELIAKGGRIRRHDWASGAFLLQIPGSTITVDADRPLGKAAPELVGQQVRYKTHIDIFDAGEMSPWHATDADINADDWETC